jgi:RNA polymerase sigma factor (TIGR02999 family)
LADHPNEVFLEAVYDALRAIARNRLRRERDINATLQPTELVHEAYQRLVISEETPWRNAEHFLALASVAMRRILIDRARRKLGPKQGGHLERVEWDDNHGVLANDYDRLILIEEALNRLEALDPRKAQVVEMMFFGGLTQDQVAAALDINIRTVKREWKFARAWLGDYLGGKDPSSN